MSLTKTDTTSLQAAPRDPAESGSRAESTSDASHIDGGRKIPLFLLTVRRPPDWPLCVVCGQPLPAQFCGVELPDATRHGRRIRVLVIVCDLLCQPRGIALRASVGLRAIPRMSRQVRRALDDPACFSGVLDSSEMSDEEIEMEAVHQTIGWLGRN